MMKKLFLISLLLILTSCEIQKTHRISPQMFQPRFLIEWHNNTEGDLAGYIVWHGWDVRDYTNFDTVYTNSFILQDVATDCVYHFAVTAFDTAGNESSFSDEVTGIIYTQSPPDTTAPSPPGGINCTALK
jgi:hypothetical protein